MPIYKTQIGIVRFTHIPKTGGSAIESWLRNNFVEGLNDYSFDVSQPGFSRCSAQHFYEDIFARIFRPNFFDYQFCVVRHPVDRLISEYKFRNFPLPSSRDFRFGVWPQGIPTFDTWLLQALEDYKANPWHLDNHLRPQSEFTNDQTEVFRFESGLNAIAARLADRLEIEKTSPLETVLASANVDVAPNERSLEAIADAYRVDFEKFGYSL